MKMADDVRLDVKGISKTYGQFEALHDLSFVASRGEIIGLLGPNGAGKTTAIRVLTTVFPPTRGEFAMDGVPHTEPARIRGRIGVLPESSGYPLSNTGLEYLVYYARLYGRSKDEAEEAARRLLSMVDLAERAHSRTGTYSRGMRQRLGIARALINDPDVLFLDEPTLGFDPKGQREVLHIIRDLAREGGTTVILSTHFLEAVEEVCDRVIIINRGRTVAVGTVAEVKRHVTAPRSGRFRVSPEMHDRAVEVCGGVPGVSDVRPASPGSGVLTVTFGDGEDGAPLGTDERMNVVVSALLQARVPIVSFTLESGSLSEAFISITEEASS
jgi:ABC-2 type transport system ATP-binding protein